ncbi:MAG: 50S ribosomal protein L20 [bacterium]
MTRVKRGKTAKRHVKPVMKAAKGYRGTRSRHYKNAREAVMHARAYAYRDRRNRKRDFRRLWIARISAAVRNHGMTYGRFIEGLKKAGVAINRKSLSEMAIHQPAAFQRLVEIARSRPA